MISLTCFYSTLPPCLSLLEKLTTAGMFILMRLAVEEAPLCAAGMAPPSGERRNRQQRAESNALREREWVGGEGGGGGDGERLLRWGR